MGMEESGVYEIGVVYRKGNRCFLAVTNRTLITFKDGEVQEEEDAETDPMYDAAVRIVADTRRCSTSWIQRKLGVGYNRAAKIVEAMEKRGVVGPANGSKDREVLIGSI